MYFCKLYKDFYNVTLGNASIVITNILFSLDDFYSDHLYPRDSYGFNTYFTFYLLTFIFCKIFYHF